MKRPANARGAAPRNPAALSARSGPATPTTASVGGRSGGPAAPAPDSAGETILPLLTPAEAARLLAVRESWLRRRATARAVPCTFLGKHLRFSRSDVLDIATAAAHPAARPAVARPAAARSRAAAGGPETG